MRNITWSESDQYPVALLIKNSAFMQHEIEKNYLVFLEKHNVPGCDVVAMNLKYNDTGKAPVAFIKAYLAELLPALDSIGSKILYVADTNYFKVLTGKAKADIHYGYVLACALKGYEHMMVVLGTNHQALIYNPELKAKLDLGLHTIATYLDGTYSPPGEGVIHSAKYPKSLPHIRQELQKLHQYPSLSCDIEAFTLSFNTAGIGTIAFAWDENNGIAFACDYLPIEETIGPVATREYGTSLPNPMVRELIKEFFETYEGELVFHGSTYDAKVMIYHLWMKDYLDTEGLLQGLEIMTRRMHDTKIIAYLATNSTAGNILGLKHLAHEFAGNWAVEVKDIRRVPLQQLLQYNLVDALSTNYVKSKYWPMMVSDNQLDLYNTLMMPSIKLILQIELTGMPINMAKVKEARTKLEDIMQSKLDVVHKSPVIGSLNLVLQKMAWDKDYDDRRKKAKNPDKIQPKDQDVFTNTLNPNSGNQLQVLLYELMGLPVLDKTNTGQPATGAATLEKLVNHTTNQEYKEIIQALINYGKVSKILGTFIPAFERSLFKGNGTHWLHGSFNLGGTVSGRLSSSEP